MSNDLAEIAMPQTPVRVGSAAAETDSQRAIAEVQAQMVIAKRFPRNEIAARDKIINACGRKSLAESAMYTYSRGGNEITGPSIRMAEVLASNWGNIQSGWREIDRSGGSSQVESYAWDIENNVRWSLVFQVKHVRDTKQGQKKLTDERDIYELCANQAARRLRACILKAIPGDIVDDAIAECEKTLKTKADVTVDHIKRLVASFAAIGVTQEMIEARIQRRLDSITAPQVISLGKIFNSINDAMSKIEDWFDISLKKSEAAAPRASVAEKAADAVTDMQKEAIQNAGKPAAAKPAPKAAPKAAAAEKDSEEDIPAQYRTKPAQEDASTGALPEEELNDAPQAVAPRQTARQGNKSFNFED